MEQQEQPTGPTFDTLAAKEALQKAGFSSSQAKVLTRTIVDAQANLATKADIQALRIIVEANAEVLRADNKRLLDAFDGHVKALQAENKRLLDAFEAHVKVLRAENKQLAESLRADMKKLQEGISTLRWLIVGVVLPVAMTAFGVSVAVIGILIANLR